MIVTAIEPYRKDKYRIYLNDAFAFVLYKGDLRHFDIAEGKDLSEEELTSIREEVLVKRAKMRAMNLLTARDYTEDALRRKIEEFREMGCTLFMEGPAAVPPPENG